MKEEKLTETVYNRPGKILTDSGVLLLVGEFNNENILPIIARIMEFNLMPEGVRPEFITLIINSPGGSVSSMFQLVDVMKSSKIPVHTVGQGFVASCGIMTLMAGEPGHRSATHNTTIMSHSWSSGTQGTSYDLEASVKHHDFLTEKMINHYKKCTGKSESYIRKHLVLPTDMYLRPEEALQHGIIDEVKETY
jgi:ATP-dependent Clp protease protease subunit